MNKVFYSIPIEYRNNFSFTVSYFQHEKEYLEILTAVKGTEKEKRLASQFIARFFKHFPNLADQAIEAQIDLCEDEEVAVSTCFNNAAFMFVNMFVFVTYLVLK